MSNLIHEDLSESIIGSAMKVLNTLRPGLDEKLCENALVIELRKRGHRVDQQRSQKRCQDSLFGESVGIDFFFGRPRGRSVDSRPNRRAIDSTQFDCPNGLPRRIAQRMPSSSLSPSGSLTRRVQLADRASGHGDNSRGSGSLD